MGVASTEKTLDRTPRAAVRLLGLAYLADANRAAKRLHTGDPDKLHDFRVALRRFRTLVRVFRKFFDGTVRRKHRRRLRQLGRASSRRRDAQAQLAVLLALPGTSHWSNAAACVTERLEKRLRRSQDVPEILVAEFRDLRRRLGRRLRGYHERIDSDELTDAVTFKSIAVPVSAALGDELRVALATVASPADAPTLHVARLCAKRLRYTLDLFVTLNPQIETAVLALSQLQDLLGEARDTARLREIAMEARVRADASLATEFDAFTNALNQHIAENNVELQRLWLDGNSWGFFKHLMNALAAISPLAAHH